MKQYAIGIAAPALACLAMIGLAMAASRPQDESGKSKNSETRKTEEKKIAIHIKVSAEGVDPLPDRSSIQLKGLEDCDTLARRGDLDADGQIAFSELPVCKVMLKILITGFETKTVPEVDPAGHKDATLRIQIKQIGPPVSSWEDRGETKKENGGKAGSGASFTGGGPETRPRILGDY